MKSALPRAPAACLLAVALACAGPALAAPAHAPAQTQAKTQGGVGDPRLNGFWNVDAEFRDAAQRRIHPELTPAAQEISRRNGEVQRNRLAHGESVGLGSYTCGKQGVPFVVGTSEPWLLVVTPDEVVQVAERRQMIPRHFYTDGRAWPDLAKMPPAVNGYSIAHWEGKTLVIETRGMPAGGIQGGAVKGPDTVLTERVSLSADGNRLTWAYTWVDPHYLAQPLSFALEYDRAPPHTYAFTHFCDPNQDSARTVRPPSQD